MNSHDDELVRINVQLPLSLRQRFDRWCRYGPKPQMSMNKRIIDLIAADIAGKLDVPRKASRRGPKPKASAPPPHAPPAAKPRKK